MNDKQMLLDILMFELPDPNPWEGEIRLLIDRLVAHGVTVQKWVSVEERLPPFHTDLLVVSYGRVYVAGEMLTWEDGHSTVYIPFFNGWKSYTHWMLLPEPPKE